jgi:hypothetical protein
MHFEFHADTSLALMASLVLFGLSRKLGIAFFSVNEDPTKELMPFFIWRPRLMAYLW